VNEKWIKAAVLGTYWASSEIVLGSYLHNLRIPFSGNILTGIGLMILISVSYLWKEKGLFWRAGVITCLLKTISPSAVIFGPMVAILAEAFLFEAAIRLFGRTVTGYVVGSILAMSWNLFHKIANYIIYYGYNIVALYADLVTFAGSQLHIRIRSAWLPVLLLLLAQVLLGLIAAVLGMRVGRKLLAQAAIGQAAASFERSASPVSSQVANFNYSSQWLFADVLLIILCLYMINVAHWLAWGLAVTIVVVIWAFRYRRALRQLARPKFWISFVIITLLTALLLNKNGWQDGLLVGMRMNFRATVIILGFAVLGTELYNPAIRAFFRKSAFQQVSYALELSLTSLPAVIAAIPDIKTIAQKPVTVLLQLLSGIESRLHEFRVEMAPRIFFITGGVGQGKTSAVRQIVTILQHHQIKTCGIYSPRMVQDGETIGYDVVDICTGNREIFLRTNGDDTMARIGRFFINPQGLALGRKALAADAAHGARILVIDQVGQLELDGEGWSEPLLKWLNAGGTLVVLTARPEHAQAMTRLFNLQRVYFCAVADMDASAMAGCIISGIRPAGENSAPLST
jgi:nucleoside-triphosphatase THEP1